MGRHLSENGIEIVPVNQRGPSIRQGLTDFDELAIPTATEIPQDGDSEGGFRPGCCLNPLTACGDVEMNLTK